MAYTEQPRSNLSDATSSSARLGRRLDSWKEIASYLNRSEKTVRRWEENEGLPVHRLLHEKRGSVYAYSEDLDLWWSSRKSQDEGSGESPSKHTQDVEQELAIAGPENRGYPEIPIRFLSPQRTLSLVLLTIVVAAGM